jgi:hypothetical protein
MSGLAEVHVGDIGTEYRVRITDAGEPFDPTEATTKSLIFHLPSGTVSKDAEVVHSDADWFLVYRVTEAGFHTRAGRFSMQARLEFPDGSIYHSSIQTVDEHGAALAIAKNLG